MSTKSPEYWKKKLAQLQKIKNPNDYDKHQIKSAKTRIQEFQTKRNESLHSSKKPAPKTDRRGRRLKIQPKVDRSFKLDRNYKEEEAKAREGAKKFKKTGEVPTTKKDRNYEPDYKYSDKEIVFEGGKEKKAESLKISKSDKKKFPGGKDKYTAFEKSGARQSSARNSVARSKWKRKKDKLKAGK